MWSWLSDLLSNTPTATVQTPAVPVQTPQPAPAPVVAPAPTHAPVIEFSGPASKLSASDIAEVAATMNLEPALVQAVTKVEAGAGGFLADTRPKILFEAQQFSYATDHQYDVSHPNISSRTWNRDLYKGGSAEYTRLTEAIGLNRAAALSSASWGLFQIMGSNFDMCGFDTVERYVAAMVQSEEQHLLAFAKFLQTSRLDVKLRAHDWAGFAKGYNGPGYASNDYDAKLAAAYSAAKES